MRGGRGWLVGGGALAVALIGLELALRVLHPLPQRHHVWPPNLRLDFEPSEAATPGVSGVGRFRTNSLGLRSDEPPAGGEQVVYVFGGSTAIDLYLDQDEAWVQLLQSNLNRAPGFPRTWVGNLARPSLATIHDLLYFERLLPELPRAQRLVDLVGVNDLQLALKSSYLGDLGPEGHLRLAFARMPPRGGWERLATIRAGEDLWDAWRRSRLGVVQTRRADGYARWRECRQSVPAENLVDRLPDLSAALAQYRGNLETLVDRARDYGAPILFLTQPTLWAGAMGPTERSRLLAGGLGPSRTWCADRRYYSAGALAAGMRAFNDTLLDVCRTRRIACFDLAAAVPKRAEYFYDDMHFSEAGARLVADLVAGALLRSPP